MPGGFFGSAIIAYNAVGKSLIQGLSGFIHHRKAGFLRQGPSVRGKKLNVPLKPEDGAILVQQGVVFCPCDTSAACGNHRAGELAKLKQSLCFPSAEAALAFCLKNFRNGAPGKLANERIGIEKGFPCLLR